MKLEFKIMWDAVYRNPAGSIGWEAHRKNLVPNQFLNGILNATSTFADNFYIGLVDNASFSAYAAADTAASHAGWIEFTNYSETTRQLAVLATSVAQSRTNSASKAVFTFLGSGTIKGAFMQSSNVKGGTAGYLVGEVNFGGGNQAVTLGGTLEVTVTITAASA